VKPHFGTVACLGGSPAFMEKLHVGRPNIGNEDRFFERVRKIFDRRWFSNHGCCVQEFEERLKERLGVKNCIPICNATVAIETPSGRWD
jgi:dTDP-4-amino-4,6-dideoxygalactose transaminase